MSCSSLCRSIFHSLIFLNYSHTYHTPFLSHFYPYLILFLTRFYKALQEAILNFFQVSTKLNEITKFITYFHKIWPYLSVFIQNLLSFFFLLVLAFVFQKTIEFVTMSKLFGNFLNSGILLKYKIDKKI